MIETASVVLEIPLHPIRILSLTETGTMPDGDGESEVAVERPLYESKHLPPRNRTEHQLMSVWVSTHHAMFMTVAMSSYSIFRAITSMNLRDVDSTLEWLGFARDARLASAAYTDLPELTQALYEAYVRESMKLVHAGFSGVSNRESIVMELALRHLKDAVQTCRADDREFAHSIGPAYQEVADADHFWWRSHGQAMRRMVRKTVSLARMDAQEKANETGGRVDFEEYRQKILRDPKALSEYDGYFAVERRTGLGLDHWQRALTSVLNAADDYIAWHGPVAERWQPARPQLFELMKRAAASPQFVEVPVEIQAQLSEMAAMA